MIYKQLRYAFCLFLILGLSLNSSSSFAKPKTKKSVVVGVQGKQALSVAAFQLLGADNNFLFPILEAFRRGYKQRTGKSSMPLAILQGKMRKYGLSRLGQCSMKTACFIRVGKKSLKISRYLLAVGLGKLVEKIHGSFILVDLVEGKELKRKSKVYQSLDELYKAIPLFYQEAFPNFGKIHLDGLLPIGAKISLDDSVQSIGASAKLPCPSGRKVELKIKHPSYQPFVKSFLLKQNEVKKVEFQLQKLDGKAPVLVRKEVILSGEKEAKDPFSPTDSTKKGKVWYKSWVVWAITGGVVVGAGIAIGVAASKANKPPPAYVPF